MKKKNKGPAQLRIQTRDAFVNVSETHPDGDGFSWKMYGPFATADEQRTFMRDICNSAPMTSEDDRTSLLATVNAWVRFDEEEGYEPPEPEPIEPAAVAPTPHESPEDLGPVSNDIRFFLNGVLKRPVW